MVLMSKDVHIESSHGYHLAATLDMPDTTPVAWAVFSHCFAGSRFTPGAKRVSQRLAQEHSIAVCRFDFSGLGQSGGHFPDTTFDENVADVLKVSQWLAENYEAPSLLIGHSLGGATVSRAAHYLPAVKAVATIGSPVHPGRGVLRFMADSTKDPLDPTLEFPDVVPIDIHGSKLTISGTYARNLVAQNPRQYFAAMDCPLLLLHSRDDHIVDFSQTAEILTLAPHATLHELQNSDHLLLGPGAGHTAADILAEWAKPILRES